VTVLLLTDRNLMLMIDVTSIDARPGEAEIVSLMADYMAARLFTPRQRTSLSVIIDLTSQPVRVPVTRAMLAPKKSGLGTHPPHHFEMTASTAAGIRDAAEIVAHELLHISQAVNGRLRIMPKWRKINGSKRLVDMARWVKGKPVMIDELAWQHRPWEIEACHWQSRLVWEFLALASGQQGDQPVQTSARGQLALYPVDLAAPAMAARSQEPEFSAVSVMPVGPSADDSGVLPVASVGEGWSIDRADPQIAPAMTPERCHGDFYQNGTGHQPADTVDSLRSGFDGAVQGYPVCKKPVHERPIHMGTVHMGTVQAPEPDMSDTVMIEVDVPGLESPRALACVVMSRKLDELRDRGLVGG
jgi:hypothetical protein